jgi:hypothetical protein
MLHASPWLSGLLHLHKVDTGPSRRSARQPNQWGCPGRITVDIPPAEGAELWLVRLEWLERGSRIDWPIFRVGGKGELPPPPGIIVWEKSEGPRLEIPRELLFGNMF